MKQKCATVIALNKWDITQTDLEDARRRSGKLRQRPQAMAVATSGCGMSRWWRRRCRWRTARRQQIPTPEPTASW